MFHFRVLQNPTSPQVWMSITPFNVHAHLYCTCIHVGFTRFLPSAETKARKEKLEQVASFSLFGNVMSMASVQLVGASRDALLLSFKDAKVRSIIMWD